MHYSVENFLRLFIGVNLVILTLGRNPVIQKPVMPNFDRPSENVTVIIGSFAVLPCFVNNLGDHKVAWIKVSNNDILAIGDYRVTNDDRIKLQHSYVSDWSLSIQPISEDDQGEYICQVNTEPQIITKIVLQVLLPPKIIEEKSTIMPEPVLVGETLRLYCHAEGMPAPQVSWYFRHLSNAPQSAQKRNHHTRMRHLRQSVSDQIFQEGSTLVIKNISTHYSGIFECIANNSVPPAASRKIKVNVEFGPEVEVESSEVEHAVGSDVRLECRIKANPLVNHYWMKDDIVIESSLMNMHFVRDSTKPVKYDINIFNQNNKEYLTVSSLVIKNLDGNDFGSYHCVAVNSYNTSRAKIVLKESVDRSQKTTKVSASRILFYNSNHNKQSDIENGDLARLTTRPGTGYNRSEPAIRLNTKFLSNGSISCHQFVMGMVSSCLGFLLLRIRIF